MLRILIRGGLATLWPWVILAISFAVNLAFYAVAGDDPAVVRQSGGILSLFLTAIAANQQSWSNVLPFTLGLSGTRRGFVAGMGLFVLAQSVLAGALLTGLAGIESLTKGWTMDVRFFRTPILDALTAPGRFAVVSTMMLAVSALGAILGAVLVRWGSTGLWWLVAGLGVAGGAAVVAVAATGGWAGSITALAGQPWAMIWVGIPAAVTALSATATWLIARRVALR